MSTGLARHTGTRASTGTLTRPVSECRRDPKRQRRLRSRSARHAHQHTSSRPPHPQTHHTLRPTTPSHRLTPSPPHHLPTRSPQQIRPPSLTVVHALPAQYGHIAARQPTWRSLRANLSRGWFKSASRGYNQRLCQAAKLRAKSAARGT